MRFTDQPINLQAMRTMAVRILLLALVFVLIRQPAQAQSDETNWLLAQINALRQRNGVAPLTLNAHLVASATAHSSYLATHTYGDPHREANGSTPASRAAAAGYPGALVGENVVGGTGASVQWAMNWWVQSPIHLHNMLVDWTEIGIGIVDGPYGKWYTTDFGSPGGGQAPPPAAPVSAGPSGPTAQVAQVAQVPTSSNPAKPNLSPPTRRPTRVPTLTPTVTLTPSITFTPRPTLTPSLTPTGLPPTGTAIVLEITPETALTQAQPDVRITDDPSAPVAIALVETPAAPRPLAPANPGDGIRSLIPWIIAVQGVIVGGLFANAILRRRR